MPKDYKNRSHQPSAKPKKIFQTDFVASNTSLIIAAVVVASLATAYFLTPDVSDSDNNIEAIEAIDELNDLEDAEEVAKKQLQNKTIQALAAKAQFKLVKKNEPPSRQNNPAEEPHFDFQFYGILPELETVIPENEIKKRIKKEQTDTQKTKNKYIMQAGSFKKYTDASRLKEKLTALGIESHIEQAKVKEVILNRVKIGPFSNLSSVMEIKNRLKSKKMDSLVLEFEG
ncbi:MAG: SPOR domain-containing protein [Methylococcales bacterium]|nr:SPOR domain-containing protein [Methylococcales bacterium]